MKIVDRITFLNLPNGTVFSRYTPCSDDGLYVKVDTWKHHPDDPCHWDYLYDDIGALAIATNGFQDGCDALDASQMHGQSLEMDYTCTARAGGTSEGDLFAVLELKDVQALIERLQTALQTQTQS